MLREFGKYCRVHDLARGDAPTQRGGLRRSLHRGGRKLRDTPVHQGTMGGLRRDFEQLLRIVLAMMPIRWRSDHHTTPKKNPNAPQKKKKKKKKKKKNEQLSRGAKSHALRVTSCEKVASLLFRHRNLMSLLGYVPRQLDDAPDYERPNSSSTTSTRNTRRSPRL